MKKNEIELTEVEVMEDETPLEKVIENTLVKYNVTNAVISALKSKYGSMKLGSVDNKEQYLEIKMAAKECAKVRSLTTKVCKEGRESAVKIQKAWVAEEKRVISLISEVEDPLDAEIALYDAEIDRKAAEEKERQEEAYINRQAVLTKMGATYSGGSFVLGDASFEAELIKSSSGDVWEEAIVPKFNEEYQKIEAVRVEEKRVKDEAEAEFKRQQDKLLQQQKELKEAQDEMKRQKDAADKKEFERISEEKRLKAEADNKRWRDRLALIDEVGWNGQFAFSRIGDREKPIFTYDELVCLSDEIFNDRLKEANSSTVLFKKELSDKAEVKRLKDIEDAKELAIQQEKKRLSDVEAKRQADLEASKDKDKWEAFISEVNKLETFEMRSGQYRNRMRIAKEKIAEILSL